MLSAFAGGTLPIQGSGYAADWDQLYDFMVWMSVFFFILVCGAMIYFVIRYSAKKNPTPKYITGNHLMEAIWVVVPGILLMVIFGWGYSVYHTMTNAPSNAYEIRVVGEQWKWRFYYDNGAQTAENVYVPMNRPVKFIMTSRDVIHNFSIPNFRVKQDVVPGMYTSVWFETAVHGRHQVFCSQYCGAAHSLMLANVVALNDKEWKYWIEGKADSSDKEKVFLKIPKAGMELGSNDSVVIPDSVVSAQSAPSRETTTLTALQSEGKKTYALRGCASCHSLDGSQKIGPSWKGLYGKHVELTDGTTVVADENYIRESIEMPNAKLVKGFAATMPTFKGLINEQEMAGLIAYIKTLDPVKTPVKTEKQ